MGWNELPEGIDEPTGGAISIDFRNLEKSEEAFRELAEGLTKDASDEDREVAMVMRDFLKSVLPIWAKFMARTTKGGDITAPDFIMGSTRAMAVIVALSSLISARPGHHRQGLEVATKQLKGDAETVMDMLLEANKDSITRDNDEIFSGFLKGAFD